MNRVTGLRGPQRALTCWFVRRRRIAETTLREARDELQSKIEERQAELARVSRMMTIGEMGLCSEVPVVRVRVNLREA
jgi:C4-dicarboxylate-specific signal transduction histidine kinase